MGARYAMGSVAVVVLAAWGVLWAWHSASPVRQFVPAGPAGKTPASLGFAGSGGCSALHCHGGTEPVKDAIARQNEYTISLAYDKHTRAYRVLLEKRARIMARNLAVTNPGGAVIPPHLDQRCLACHTTPEAANQPDPQAKVRRQLLNFREEGVSCEACHGPSKKQPKPWYALHTVPEKWRKKYEKNPHDPVWKEYTFTDVGDLKVQAETCAGCHVGAPPDDKRGIPARDVNHDLMAAGHPRLNFELTAFRANMPPHWNVARKEGKKPGVYQARSWAVGQVVSARAALKLLQYRTSQATKNMQKPDATVRWPEFAEYRCFACHANLNPGWRDRTAPPGLAIGSLPYDPWYNTMLPALFKAVPDPRSSNVAADYRKLSAALARPDNLERIDEDATRLLKALDGWLGENGGKKDYDPKKLLKEILADADKPATWERAVQLTLAAAALRHKSIVAYAKNPSGRKPKDLMLLEATLRELAFPDESESPAGLTGPFAANKAFQKRFTSLLDQLKE